MGNILQLGNKGKKQNDKQPSKAPTVSVKQSKSVECKECQHDIYVQAVHLRKIPKIIVGSPQDVLIPIDVFLCANCGTLNTELLPQEIREFFE